MASHLVKPKGSQVWIADLRSIGGGQRTTGCTDLAAIARSEVTLTPASQPSCTYAAAAAHATSDNSVISGKSECAQRDSNPRPLASKANRPVISCSEYGPLATPTSASRRPHKLRRAA